MAELRDKVKCNHVWVHYYSLKTRQCIDCKIKVPLNKSAGLTEHKRKSGIGPDNYNNKGSSDERESKSIAGESRA